MSGSDAEGIDMTHPPAPMPMPVVDHPTDRPNFCVVRVDETSYWFSYRTCIAFSRPDGKGIQIRENNWGPTTGKHLRYVEELYGCDRKGRIPSDAFELALEGGYDF